VPRLIVNDIPEQDQRQAGEGDREDAEEADDPLQRTFYPQLVT
jgi:hypothetical protein